MCVLTKQLWTTLCLLLTAVLLPVSFIACSDGGDSGNTETPDPPVNPVEYKEVPVSGGTVEYGDVAIEFPSGTYDDDKTVGISEVTKGEICGDLEASAFYQLSLPVSSNKPLTVKKKPQLPFAWQLRFSY